MVSSILELRQFKKVIEQFPYRNSIIKSKLLEWGVKKGDLSAVVGRSGPRVKESGIYEVNEQMADMVKSEKVRIEHPAILGCILAKEIADEYQTTAYVPYPPAIEWPRIASISGIPLIERRPAYHRQNIEAVAITSDSIYLFHRGNLSTNFIAAVSKFDFLKYFDIGSPIPQINLHQFNLPDHEGTSSGFSGACITPDSLGLLFTASLEATDNEIYDGEVVGSYVGLIPLRTINKGKYIASILTDRDKSILPLKLEGISVIKNISAKHEQFQALAVIDNDDGTSKFVKINIQLK